MGRFTSYTTIGKAVTTTSHKLGQRIGRPIALLLTILHRWAHLSVKLYISKLDIFFRKIEYQFSTMELERAVAINVALYTEDGHFFLNLASSFKPC